MMSSSFGQDLVALLKRIDYPDAGALDPTSFDWMFEDKELIPFLETICFDIQEDNVLSCIDIANYREFQANEFLDSCEIEKIEISTDILVKDDNMQKEMIELKEDITDAEMCISTSEEQFNNLTIRNTELLEENKELLEQKQEIEKEIMKIKDETLPNAIKRFADAIDAIIHLIQEFSAWLKQQQLNGGIRKSFFQVPVQRYLEKEMTVMEVINIYLHDSFKSLQYTVNSTWTEDTFDELAEELSVKELQIKLAAEVLRLQEVMLPITEEYFKFVLEEKKLENKTVFFNNLFKKNDFSSYNIPILQLQNKCEKLCKNSKEVEEEERKMLKNFAKVLDDHYKVQYEWMTVLCSKEKLNRYKLYLELLETPLDVLYEQRAKLEFLIVAFTLEENSLKEVKNSILSFKQTLETEVAQIQKRLVHYKDQVKETPLDVNCIGEGSIMFTLYQIISNFESGAINCMLYLTTDNVVEEAKKLKLIERSLLNESSVIVHGQLQLLNIAKANVAVLYKHVHGEKGNYKEHPLFILDKFIMNIGILSSMLKTFEEQFLLEMNKYLQKKEVISENTNIALSRKLFVYALTNKQKFERAVKEIKDRVERYENRKRFAKNLY